MFAVGRLGSYISQGVYTVSGPFHPFGGAVDIIVVQQQDGSFKSSPWYVRFGKFQGVLKSKEKVVTICVEGVDVGFNMLLDNKGEAYFLREVDEGEELESALYRFSSVNETNRQSHKDTGQRKSKSCNFDSFSGCDNPMDMSKEKDTGRAKTGQSRILGLFGRKTTKEETQTPRGKEVNNNNNDSNNHARRASSMERAEMATDLMDMQWSTNIPSKKTDAGNAKADKDFKTEKLKRSSEEASVGVSRSRTSSAGEVISLTSRETYERDGDANGITGPRSRATCGTCAGNADRAAKANGVLFPNSQYQCPVGCEGRSAQQFLVQQSCCNQRDSVSQGCTISQMHGNKNGLQTASLNREMSDSSIDGFNDSSKQTSHTTTEQPLEDTHTQQPELAEHTENHFEQTRSSRPCTPERNEEDLRNSSRISEACSEIHRVDPVLGSSNSGQEIEDEKIFGDGSIRSSPQQNVAFDGDSKRIYGDSISTEVTCDDGVSQSSEEEQFLFGDLDEDKLNAVHKVEPKSPDHKDKENHHLFGLDGAKEMQRSVSTSYESYSSVDQFVRENPTADSENLPMKSSEISNPIGIPRTPLTPVVGRLGESAPNMWFHVEDLDDSSSGCHSLSHSLDASPRSLKWTLLGKDDPNWLHSNAEREGQLGKERLDPDDAQISGETYPASVSPKSRRLSFGSEQKIESKGITAVAKPVEKDSSKPPATQGRKWRIWPFGFRTTRSGNNNEAPPGYVRLPDSEDAAESAAEIVVESAAEIAVESAAESVAESAAESVAESAAGSAAESLVDFDVDKSELTYKGVKKILRSLTPTSEQLASLKLSEGKNSITFTFSTGMLGEQQVDARIYLWKWNTRIVISDVDGTITKSDVLGQFMPMVGIDWCQTGVTHLFSAIKENGYQLLFLSARAIAQAYTTRQFLLSIKQDGKGLPDGPIVISPDGLFPSLFREVIRRAPHEFKIACLEDIKALFPVGSNPFYAGFGNRDTDEISYLKVGIPMGKIFIINPKGEVAVNRRVDRKSYTSLHNLVNGMFPPTEPEQEDFNSWNFWKMPPPSLM